MKAFRLDITPEVAQALADELSRAAEAGLFHPSIVEPIAAGVEGSLAYGAEEYVAAESLDVAMRHYAPSSIATVLPFITQLAGALDFARAAGVGHGALHPRDIFVTPEEARATGFGVVEALERVGLRAPVRRPYTAPERIAGEAWSTPADVFSLAAITFELLTGRRPAGPGPEIGPLTAGTPNEWMDGVWRVLARGMDEQPAARYPTALAFASALEGAARGETPAPMEGPAIASAAATVAPSGAAGALTAPLAAGSVADARKEREDAGDERDDAGEEPEDVSDEREDDEAHHRLLLSELEDETAPRPSLALDEDIAAEAEADRLALEGAALAGSATAPGSPAAHAGGALLRHDGSDDDPGNRADIHPSLDARALEDDEVLLDEPPTPSFRPDDLVRATPLSVPAPVSPDQEATHRKIERWESGAPHVPAWTAADPVRPPSPGGGRWPLAAMLVLGLGAGLGAGYLAWGRAPVGTAGSGATAPAAGPPRTAGEDVVNAPAESRRTAAPSKPEESGARPGAPPPAAARPPAARPPARASAGTLTVRSTPSNAGVTLNGRWRGRTPLTLEELPFARYTVRVVREGYLPASQAVSLDSSEPSRSLSFRLEQPARRAAPATERRAGGASPEPAVTGKYTGSIYVDSRPRGAAVSINGRRVGVTPLRLPDVRIGSHVVRLELPDHRIWSSTARVAAGEESRVTGSLERIQ